MSRNKLTTEEFIEKAREIHGNKYDYSKTEYIDRRHKVCIICPEHGEFWQLPGSHLKGCGCFICGVRNSAIGHLSTTEKFIKKAKLIHGDKYDYSKTKYVKSSEKVKIKCSKCGNIFEIAPNAHLKGQGCHCLVKKGPKIKSTDKFIAEAKEIHGDKYDYSKTRYFGNNKKIVITCPIHGDFYQIPSGHLRGQGCPKCNLSKLEENVSSALTDDGIHNIRQYKCENLGKQSLDFYLPEYEIGIECQGRQHVYPVNFGGITDVEAGEYLAHLKILDKKKKDICDKIGIKILYYMSDDISNEIIKSNNIYTNDNTFWDITSLLESIKHIKNEDNRQA